MFTLEKDSIPTQRQLRRAFFEKRELLIVYEAKDQKLKQKYKSLLDQISQSTTFGRRNITIRYKAASAVNENDLKNNVLLLIGTPASNSMIKRLSVDLPISFSEDQITFNQNTYINNEKLLSILYYPNPENYKLPVSFLIGNDENTVFNFFSTKIKEGSRSLLGQNMDYEIYHHNNRVLMGNFDSQWKIDKTVYFDYTSGNDTIYKSEHFDFITHQNTISQTEISDLASKIEYTTKQITDFTGSRKDLPRFSYHIYKTAEDKGLMINNTNQANFSVQDNSIHTVINKKYKGNYIEKENALLLHHLLDSSKTIALEKGLPVYFTKKWQREGYLYWAARLFESGNSLSLKEVLDNELIQKESPLIGDCMSATVVTFLLKEWGRALFLKKYKAWKPSDVEIRKLEPKWKSYLSQLAIKIKKKTRIKPQLSNLKGFNFAHEGYSIYNGYLSRKATQALEKQKEMGGNAIAIVPYSYLSNNNTPDYFPISNWPGSENDQGIIHSALEAKHLGMTTMLKPQVFVGNSWPGEIEMKSEDDWNIFFDHYYRWIRHYAFLAEIHQIDMLCMGVEFSVATLTHEHKWKEMFRKIKGFYQGLVTYAANWGEEFESVGFWDELDFIGLNSYYPLSKKDNPTDEELKASFEVVKSKIEKVYKKFKKPIVFTEIGFRSMNMPWKNPYEDGDNSFNEEHQERCYRIIFEGLQDVSWCKGILWWKFPSFLEYRGIKNDAFTPNNKKAEATVKEWFLK
ncbi:hypothetical protein GTQ40_14690 [Flavobacteriaceae bacterium R38]|nr:hypothetical protein [Flavobacteriaceae bacterium R38]